MVWLAGDLGSLQMAMFFKGQKGLFYFRSRWWKAPSEWCGMTVESFGFCRKQREINASQLWPSCKCYGKIRYDALFSLRKCFKLTIFYQSKNCNFFWPFSMSLDEFPVWFSWWHLKKKSCFLSRRIRLHSRNDLLTVKKLSISFKKKKKKAKISQIKP